MKISHKRTPLHFAYSANNVFLQEVQHYKYLGLWISNDLNWTRHINTVISSCNYKLFYLRRALKLSTPAVRLIAFNAIVQPSLDYASIIWYPHTRKNISEMEKIQKRAVRFIYNSFGRTSITRLLSKANLSTPTQRNKVLRLKFFFQLVKGYFKLDLSHILHLSTGYTTRQRHAFTITPFSTRNNTFKYSFFPRTITEWNNLSNEVVSQSSLNLFAAQLQQRVSNFYDMCSCCLFQSL